MRALAVTRASLRRLAADRTALFFLLVLPIVVILVVGATVGGFGRFRVAVVDQGAGPLGRDLRTALAGTEVLDVEERADLAAARDGLRRSELDAVVVLPQGMDAELRAGGAVEVVVISEPTNSNQRAARSAVAGVVARHGAAVQAAQFAAEHVGGDFGEHLARARVLHDEAAPLLVQREMVDADSNYLPEGFAYSAPTMLVLFVFLNSVAAGAALIQSRRLGVHARVLAAPIGPGTLVAGETLAYLAIALGQSLLIVTVGAAAFGVTWGDPLAAAGLVTIWALVGTGAGVLSGTLFRTPEQASSIGPAVGIALAMLGGAMWPLEIVPRAMQLVGRAVPHGWAVDGWVEVLSRNGGLTDVAGHLLVLAGFATALLLAATVRLRSRLVA